MVIASRKTQVTDLEKTSPESKDAPQSALEVRLQKTKLCMYHMRSVCKHGSSCRFAHGEEELIKQPDLSKTRMCPDMLAGGCTNPNCHHAHRLDEIKATNFCYKTTQCMWYASGRCRNGNQCHFAHGEADRDTWLDKNKVSPNQEKGKQKQLQQQQRQTEDEEQQQQQEQQDPLLQLQQKQKQLQKQFQQLQQLQQLQQWPPNFGEFQSKQQQQQLLQQEQHKQLQERQQREHLQVLQLQQQQQQQHQTKNRLEPMFIQSTVSPMMPNHPLSGLLGMPEPTTSLGYPLDNNAGVPPGLSNPPCFSQFPYMHNAGYLPTPYHPGLAPIPAPQAQDAAEWNEMDELSKHIKSIRKQVKKLQGNVNHAMRSDSDQSTNSGAIYTVSDSSSNEDLLPSNGPSDPQSRHVGSKMAMGDTSGHHAQALRFSDKKLVGA